MRRLWDRFYPSTPGVCKTLWTTFILGRTIGRIMEINNNRHFRRLSRQLLALRDKVVGIAFPKMARVKQITVYNCGPAVLATLYSFLGVKASQRGIIASLRVQNKIKNVGMSMKDLGRGSHIIGKGAFVFWKKNRAKMSDVETILKKYKYPVGVEWQGVFYEDEDEDNGHYSIVTAIDKKKGTLRIADSYPKFAGVDRGFHISDFMKRWWDSNEITVSGTTKKRTIYDSKMMFIIVPKGVSWPRKLGMAKAS